MKSLIWVALAAFLLAGCSDDGNGGPCGKCDDGIDCTEDRCSEVTEECVYDPVDGMCDSGKVCDPSQGCVDPLCNNNAECDDQNPCTDGICEPLEGCQYVNNISACDDGDACTEHDTCSIGSCSGTAVDCDDDNPCTDDSCDTVTGCQYVNNTASCDDGDSCTQDDTCQDGQCVGGANACPCTRDVDCGQYEDGDLCNGTLICVQQLCQVDPGTVVECDSSGDLPCRKNLCAPATGECSMTFLEDGTACDDGSPCTENDVCTQNVCEGALKACDDGDACTNDACNPSNGVCQHAAVDCNDGDECTEDSCDSATGCINDPIPGC